MNFVRHLEQITGVNWTASTNKTGPHPTKENEPTDWVMETDANIGSIANHYFVEEKLTKWHGCCVHGWAADQAQQLWEQHGDRVMHQMGQAVRSMGQSSK